ncbi:hypothetical protein NX801_04020 [Streptomyces sp. LP05-1]|uniref:Integral membrane protein n=1 Tax=Streptomyces pyxinae TaxID=2970734 RepID=A0ABT2CBP2_9ACTN|nr:hypothetical protein [Streptomyces sp. LP05-1]MCS0634837.1 hypothetical protein [Streptomyces sp. LP05-1]
MTHRRRRAPGDRASSAGLFALAALALVVAALFLLLPRSPGFWTYLAAVTAVGVAVAGLVNGVRSKRWSRGTRHP